MSRLARAIASFPLGIVLPFLHLNIPLVQFQIERNVVFVKFRFAVSRAAPIADQHVTHEGVQQAVNQRENHQDSQRPDRFVPGPGNGAQQTSCRHKR